MNLYDILGVNKNSSKKDIKKAYRKKAQETHPDKPEGSEEKFLPVKLAYEVLMDDERKENYDKTGKTEKEPSLKSKAEQMIMGAFQAIINQGEAPFNIIKQVTKAVKGNLHEVEKNKSKANRDLDKLKKLRGRINTDRDNIFESLLDERENTISQAINAMEDQILVINEAIFILTNYKDAMGDHFDIKEMGDISNPLMGNRSTGSIFGGWG